MVDASSDRHNDLKSACMAYDITSKGETVLVGLRAVAPPGISRLFYRLQPNRNCTVTEAHAAAPHRTAILLCFCIRNEEADHSRYHSDDSDDENKEPEPINRRNEEAYHTYHSSDSDDEVPEPRNRRNEDDDHTYHSNYSDDEPINREQFIIYQAASPLTLITLPNCGNLLNGAFAAAMETWWWLTLQCFHGEDATALMASEISAR